MIKPQVNYLQSCEDIMRILGGRTYPEAFTILTVVLWELGQQGNIDSKFILSGLEESFAKMEDQNARDSLKPYRGH